MAAEGTAALEGDAAFMDLYSRQIGVFGLETMNSLRKLEVLIVGCTGVGIEAAKSIVLAGCARVTVHDNGAVQPADLGVNFFLTEADIGKPRAASAVPKLQELNKSVAVAAAAGPLDEALVSRHHVVLFTTGGLDEMLRWNEFCRSQTPRPIGFIMCHMRGLSAHAFVDYGDAFTVRDMTGENPKTRVVTSIACDETGVVRIADGAGYQILGISESDHDGWVKFSGVEGCEADAEVATRIGGPSLNEAGPFQIKRIEKEVRENGKSRTVTDGYAFSVGDLTGVSPYIKGGIVTQVKQPVEVKFRSLAAALANPVNPGLGMIQFTDGAKCFEVNHAHQMHIAAQGVWAFEKANGRLPTPNSDADVDECLRLTVECNEARKAADEFFVEEVSESVVRSYARHAAVEFQPMACFFGGVVAQEVVKYTGKFTPLDGWLYHDCFEALPSDALPAEDLEVPGSRYDHTISIFGKAFQGKLLNARTFMVGCGALGCEFFKNFALLGVGCGPDGLVTTTDNDRIEVSNLNRQFLFREHNVGMPKSVAAAAAAKDMNPAINIKALETLVEPKTESVFNSKFWESQTFVTNALDNIKARVYVDSQCVLYRKPLLESGTLGTKCNVQVVVPHKTVSYADGPLEAEEEGIPQCTLRHFPSLIEHCIEWSRSKFTDMFVQPVMDAAKYAADPKGFVAELREEVEGVAAARLIHIKKKLPVLRPFYKYMQLATQNRSLEGAVELALWYFAHYYRNSILGLISTFPADKLDSDGKPFWSGAKRFPQALELDLNNPEHMTFVLSTANLIAASFTAPRPDAAASEVSAAAGAGGRAGGRAVDPALVPPGHPWRAADTIKALASKVEVPSFDPTKDVEEVDEEDQEEKKDAPASKGKASATPEEVAEYEAMIAGLSSDDMAKAAAEVGFEPADFEKDEDLNFHIDFVSSAANLRAINYRIETASRHQAKMIAGKIIPAIATTTASVTGLVMIEMFKVLLDKPLESLRDSSNNLGINTYLFCEPGEPSKAAPSFSNVYGCEVLVQPEGFTKWDQTLIEGDLSLGEFLEAFTAKTGLTVTQLNHAAANNAKSKSSGVLLYTDGENASNPAKLLPMIAEKYAADHVISEGKDRVELQVIAEDDDMNIVQVPRVVFKFA